MENKEAAYMQCEISKNFFDMVSEIYAEQKQPVDCGGKFMLYRSEINLLRLIGSCPDSNVSELSARSGVTKSAVTQISVKLSEKGLIETYKSPHNKKEKYFRLTAEGIEAKKHYEELNARAAAGMREYLCALSIEEKKTIMRFIQKAKEYMPVSSFSCSCEGQNGVPCLAGGTERSKTDA